MPSILKKTDKPGDILYTSRLMLEHAMEFREGSYVLFQYERTNKLAYDAPFTGNSWYMLALLSLEIFIKMLACFHCHNINKNHRLDFIFENLPPSVRNDLIRSINEIRLKKDSNVQNFEQQEIFEHLSLYSKNIVKVRYYFDEYFGKSDGYINTKVSSYSYDMREPLHYPEIEYKSEILQSILEALEKQCVTYFAPHI